MNSATSSQAGAETLLPSDGEIEISRPVERNIPKSRPQIEADAERIKSAVARLTSSSIDGLEGLASELQQLQEFLKCEVERVQAEIESALAGINIIIETIAPWKGMSVPIVATGARGYRAGPAANIEAAQPRR
jgi:thiamine monophosphate kinase